MGKISRTVEKQKKKINKLQHDWQVIAKRATWWLLLGAIAIDLIGMANVMNPGLLDLGAILTPIYIVFSFGTKTVMMTSLAVLSFIEEALPWLDWVPFATIAWITAKYSYKLSRFYKKL